MLIAFSSICGVISGLMILMLDTKLKRVNDNELFGSNQASFSRFLDAQLGSSGYKPCSKRLQAVNSLCNLQIKEALQHASDALLDQHGQSCA